MSNLRRTIGCLLLFFVFLALNALICKPSPLCAGTIYQLNAKGKTEGPHAGAPDFTLRYYDADGDNLFSLDELIPGTFTGVTLAGYHFTGIIGVPINGWFSPLADGPSFRDVPEAWTFTDGFKGTTWVGVFWTYSQTIVSSGKIEQWKLILDGGQGSGNCTLIKTQAGIVTADGDWIYTYQGADVTGRYSDASVTIAGSAIYITASGTATNPSVPPAYQNSPFTLSISGKACNGHGSGTFTFTFTTVGWPPNISGTWKGTRTSGSGITAVVLPCTQLLLDD